jgi:hypothetical protein
MVATHLLMTGMANCDVYDWAGPVINPAHWSMHMTNNGGRHVKIKKNKNKRNMLKHIHFLH